MKCIGYGDHEDRCENEATAPAGIWCSRCQVKRRDTIARVFERIGALFAADVARTLRGS